MKDRIEKIVVGIFLLVAAVLVIAAVAAVRNIRASIASSDWVNHTHAVILEADAVLSSLHAGEAALRNFLITGDPRDQADYRTAFLQTVEHLSVGKALTRAEELPEQGFEHLEDLVSQRIQVMRTLVQSAETEGLEGVRKLIAGPADRPLLAEIQHWVQKLKDDQNRLLVERNKASYRQAQATRWTVLTGLTFNFFLLAFVGVMIRDDLAARRRAATALQEANSQLEGKVRERTAELEEANRSLKKQNLERLWANQALAHQLHYSDLIIRSIKDLVFVVSKAQHISRINAEAMHATQYDSAELIGSPLRKVLDLSLEESSGSPDQQPLLTRALKEGREILEARAILRRKEGDDVPVLISLVPMMDHNKVVGGVITTRLATNLNGSAG